MMKLCPPEYPEESLTHGVYFMSEMDKTSHFIIRKLSDGSIDIGLITPPDEYFNELEMFNGCEISVYNLDVENVASLEPYEGDFHVWYCRDFRKYHSNVFGRKDLPELYIDALYADVVSYAKQNK